MCNREYQEAGGDEVHRRPIPRRTPRTARPPAACTFVRIIARAIEAAGPNPTREDLAAAVENLGAIDTGGEYPRQLRAGQVHGTERAQPDDVELSVPART